MLGYPDKALASVDDGVRLAKRLAHPLSLHQAFFYGAVLHLFRREPEMVLPHLRAGEVVAADQRLALFMEPDILRSGALLFHGGVRDAVTCLPKSLAARHAI